MKLNIMFVDDSIGVLKSLRWIFMDEPYHIFLFENPHKALIAIESNEFAVVVADQSMSEMEGLEFLKKVKQRSPDTVGIIMSGFVKPEAVSKAINRGVVTQFIEKPLNINEIKQAVAIALVRYKSNVESRRETMSILQPREAFLLKQ
jgi:DNA-binding NtrC family response regulator